MLIASFNHESFRAAREKKHASQSTLAEQVGTTDRYIRDLETGRKRNPSAVLLCQLCVGLDVTMESLMDIHEEKT